VVLQSVARSELKTELAFKGGNALRFVYRNRRSTVDLDFTAAGTFPDSKDSIQGWLDSAFAQSKSVFGIKMRCQSTKRNPPGAGKTFPTYQVKVSFQFPADRHFADFEQVAGPFNPVVEMEISLNDVVCETSGVRLSDQDACSIRVCVLEDILAEKLRALLQQRIRKRQRRQDVYDIARMLRLHERELNLGKIGTYLLAKAKARDVPVARGEFDGEIRRYAAFEYETLFSATDPEFIPFDEAWAEVLRLVGRLDIPD
jgi:predicted nucleotidyltransferase component of viral defense system